MKKGENNGKSGCLVNQPTIGNHVMEIIQQLRPDVQTLHSSMVLPRETSLKPLPPGDEEASSGQGLKLSGQLWFSRCWFKFWGRLCYPFLEKIGINLSKDVKGALNFKWFGVLTWWRIIRPRCSCDSAYDIDIPWTCGTMEMWHRPSKVMAPTKQGGSFLKHQYLLWSRFHPKFWVLGSYKRSPRIFLSPLMLHHLHHQILQDYLVIELIQTSNLQNHHLILFFWRIQKCRKINIKARAGTWKLELWIGLSSMIFLWSDTMVLSRLLDSVTISHPFHKSTSQSMKLPASSWQPLRPEPQNKGQVSEGKRKQGHFPSLPGIKQASLEKRRIIPPTDLTILTAQCCDTQKFVGFLRAAGICNESISLNIWNQTERFNFNQLQLFQSMSWNSVEIKWHQLNQPTNQPTKTINKDTPGSLSRRASKTASKLSPSPRASCVYRHRCFKSRYGCFQK